MSKTKYIEGLKGCPLLPASPATERTVGLTMNIRDAAYMTGHHYPGGVPALAARMGMDALELTRKLNPNAGAISLDEAVVLMTLSGDHRILHAMAVELGHTLAPQPSEASQFAGPSRAYPLRVIRTSIIL